MKRYFTTAFEVGVRFTCSEVTITWDLVGGANYLTIKYLSN
jgi:hypothetical protein